MPRSSSGTSAAEALYALTEDARSIVVVGTAKNAGKTTTFNAVRAAARRRGRTLAVTSIGRDGEPVDAIDSAAKPRVALEAGTFVALPWALVPASPALEILETGEPTALGPMVFARAVVPARCEIGGPPSARAMRAVIARLQALANGPVIVDGAIDRVAPLAGGDDAVIVATGMASGEGVDAVAARTAAAIARLSLPGRDPAAERERVVRVEGVLDEPAARALRRDARGATVVVADPTRVVVRGDQLARVLDAVDLRCERPVRVVAVTTCSVLRERTLPVRALLEAVAHATRRPAFDVVADLAA